MTRIASSAFVQDLQKRKEILLTVRDPSTGRASTFPVWFIVQGETLWLLPVRGPRTRWYQKILINPTLVIRTGRLRRTFLVRPVDHPKTVAAVVAAFRKKYTPRAIARYYTNPTVAVEVPLDPRYTPVTPT